MQHLQLVMRTAVLNGDLYKVETIKEGFTVQIRSLHFKKRFQHSKPIWPLYLDASRSDTLL